MPESEKQPVSSNEYDEEWIKETWGWDTPEFFIKTQGRNLRPRITASLELATMQPGMRILDIGCGRGEVILYCGRAGINAVGIDYSEPALKLARQAKATHSKEEQDKMHFIQGDVDELMNTEPFDRIFMLDIVEHLHDQQLNEIFSKCFSLLKPDGFMIIHTLPNKWVYDITYSKIIRLFMPWLPKNPRSEKEKVIHVNEMTIVHLYRLLTKAQFHNHVWLKDIIVEQARWHKKQPLKDNRGNVYKFLGMPIFGFLYQLIAKTPLRLLLVNEMFAIAWKDNRKKPIRTPLSLTERITIGLMG
ncbi:MAG: class I SAM-dependent methyltransferase [Candidatus Electrothrix sp. AX2]|nr:class I SAM-dependent methyltransferase [Candidatus Electrothrix gigas]